MRQVRPLVRSPHRPKPGIGRRKRGLEQPAPVPEVTEVPGDSSRVAALPKQLLDAAQVANRPGLAVETVQRKARRGDLPSVLISPQVRRFRPEDFPA